MSNDGRICSVVDTPCLCRRNAVGTPMQPGLRVPPLTGKRELEGDSLAGGGIISHKGGTGTGSPDASSKRALTQ